MRDAGCCFDRICKSVGTLRGGPMWYADTVGLKKVYDKIREFEKQHGSLWAPAPLLKQLAESGKTFADFDKSKGE